MTLQRLKQRDDCQPEQKRGEGVEGADATRDDEGDPAVGCGV